MLPDFAHVLDAAMSFGLHIGRPLCGGSDVRRSAIMRIMLLSALVAPLHACDPYAPEFTTVQPQASNVVGRYRLGSAVTLDLAANGTFAATNVPPSVVPAGSDTLSCLVTGSGTWRLEQNPEWSTRGVGARWLIALDSTGATIKSPALLGNPPYALLFISEDSPRRQTLITLKKEKSQRSVAATPRMLRDEGRDRIHSEIKHR